MDNSMEYMFVYIDEVVMAVVAEDVKDEAMLMQWAKEMYCKGKKKEEAINIVNMAYSLFNKWRQKNEVLNV